MNPSRDFLDAMAHPSEEVMAAYVRTGAPMWTPQQVAAYALRLQLAIEAAARLVAP